MELTKLIQEYIADYEFRGDDGDYCPSDNEKILIMDCILGLIEESEFKDFFKNGAMTPEEFKDLKRQIWGCFGFAYNDIRIKKGVDAVMTLFEGNPKPAKCIYFDDLECENDPECNPETQCLSCGLLDKFKKGLSK